MAISRTRTSIHARIFAEIEICSVLWPSDSKRLIPVCRPFCTVRTDLVVTSIVLQSVTLKSMRTLVQPWSRRLICMPSWQARVPPSVRRRPRVNRGLTGSRSQASVHKHDYALKDRATVISIFKSTIIGVVSQKWRWRDQTRKRA